LGWWIARPSIRIDRSATLHGRVVVFQVNEGFRVNGPARTRRQRPWYPILGAGIAATALYYLLDNPWQLAWGNVIACGAVAAMAVVLWRRRPAPLLPWLLLLAGVACFAVGDLMWTWYDQVAHTDPFPSAADIVYLAGYPLLAASLVLLIRGRAPRGDWGSLIDATVIAVGTGLLVWEFLVEPYVRDASLSLLERVVSIAYPVGDVLLIALAARFAVTPGRRTAAFRALLAALVLVLYADAVFAALDLLEGYTGASPADGGYLLSYVLFAVTFLHPSMRDLPQAVDPGAERLSRGRLVALAAASLMAPVVLAVQRLTAPEVELLVVAGSAAVLFLLVVTRMAGLVRAVERAQAERGRLLDRTVHVAEQERARLAAELHDGPIQHLTSLAYDLERACLSLVDGRVDGGIRTVRKTEGMLRQEVGELRRLIVELRPPALDKVGLEAAVREQVAEFQRRTRIDCAVEVALPERLAPDVETVLYRVAREALTNVEKHARAGRVRVILVRERGAVRLEVRDDGVGFDPAAAAGTAGRDHYGLLGMRERVELAGGTWALETGPARGVTVRATFPRPVALGSAGSNGDPGVPVASRS
jgi:signal transduction histidine kinase